MNKLTPREPTLEMVDAGWKTFASNATLSGHARVALAWRAMHDAAPSVPSVEQELLEALEALVADQGVDYIRTASWDKARAAIARAKGE